MQTLPGNGEADSWAVLPPYDWQPLPGANAVGYVTDALTAPVTIVGPGSVDLWLESSAADTDIQVTLSEVRPDDKEFYVQSGWLRASHRAIDKKSSSKLDPRPTHLEEDAEPLPAGQFSLLRVEALPVGARLPRRLEDPAHRRGARRRPHALGVRHAGDGRPRDQRDLAQRRAAVEDRAAGRTEPGAAGGAAGVPVAARPAVPRLRGGGERRLIRPVRSGGQTPPGVLPARAGPGASRRALVGGVGEVRRGVLVRGRREVRRPARAARALQLNAHGQRERQRGQRERRASRAQLRAARAALVALQRDAAEAVLRGRRVVETLAPAVPLPARLRLLARQAAEPAGRRGRVRDERAGSVVDAEAERGRRRRVAPAARRRRSTSRRARRAPDRRRRGSRGSRRPPPRTRRPAPPGRRACRCPADPPRTAAPRAARSRGSCARPASRRRGGAARAGARRR